MNCFDAARALTNAGATTSGSAGRLRDAAAVVVARAPTTHPRRRPRFFSALAVPNNGSGINSDVSAIAAEAAPLTLNDTSAAAAAAIAAATGAAAMDSFAAPVLQKDSEFLRFLTPLLAAPHVD